MVDEISQQEYNLLMGNSAEAANQAGQGTDPNSLYGDFMREEKVRNIISQINPDNLMVEIEHRIRGEKKNPITQEWTAIDINRKKISEELVANFMSFLGSILNQNTSLSNFSSNEINNIMESVVDYTIRDLSDNDEKYKIVGDYNEMDRILNIICITVFSILKQAQNGMLARRLFSTLRVSENLTQTPKKTLLGDFKFW